MVKVGIVGLPNAGKSTLFSALTKLQADIANYPFATIEPNIGIIEVFDQRLFDLSHLIHPKKLTFSTIKFIDIAGLIAGASKGEGLGNLFLSNIREVDVICHIVRCFSRADVIHVNNTIDAVCDFEIIVSELFLADEVVLNRRLEKLAPKVKAHQKESIEEANFLKQILLNNLQQKRWINLDQIESKAMVWMKSLNLLTAKPMLVVANINETDLIDFRANKEFNRLVNYLSFKNIKVIPVCAKTEYEINELSPSEKEILAREFKWNEYRGLKQLTSEIFAIVHMNVFFTFGEDEVKSWAFVAGTLAPQCAGMIHSDMEKGFIKVEVVNYRDLLFYGSEAEAKKNGKFRIEGKNYPMHDGDVCTFRFNVQKKK